MSDSTISDNLASRGAGIWNNPGSRLTLVNTTVTGNANGGGMFLAGTATVTNSTISGNTGSGIYQAGGTVSITNSTIRDNLGGGIYNSRGAFVGGIQLSPGILTLTNSTIRNNTAGDKDGGIANWGVLTLTPNPPMDRDGRREDSGRG